MEIENGGAGSSVVSGSGPQPAEPGGGFQHITETDSISKKKIAIPIIIVVIIVIAAVFFLTQKPSANGSKSTTTAKTTIAQGKQSSTTAGSSTTATTTKPTTSINSIIYISGINLLWDYSGPTNETINNQKVNCGYKTYVTTATGGYVNGSGIFPYTIYMSTESSSCNLTLTKVSVGTPGFSVISTNPNLPYTIPTGSNAYVQVMIKAPASFAGGPININTYYK